MWRVMAACVLSIFVLGAVPSCFSADEPDCAFQCDPAGGGEQCPDGYSCLDDGYCHKGAHTGACGF